jgi:hypothetical protein
MSRDVIDFQAMSRGKGGVTKPQTLLYNNKKINLNSRKNDFIFLYILE